MVPIRAEWRGGLVKWDVIRGVSGSFKGLIRGCVVDNGCGSDWVVGNVKEVYGVICG